MERLIIVIGAACFLFAACGGPEATATPTPSPTPGPSDAPIADAPTATPTPAKAAWEVEWEETIAKAREEGEWVSVGGSAAIRFRPAFQVFGDKYGIEIKSSGGSSGPIVDRILAERKAGRYTIDAFWSGPGTQLTRLMPNGVLAPLREILLLPEVTDTSNWFQNKLWFIDPERTYILAYAAEAGVFTSSAWVNTDLVSREEIEAMDSLWDFLDPRFDGLISAKTLDEDSRGTLVRLYGHPDIGPDWLRRYFSPELDVSFYTDARLMIDQLIRGKAALCMCAGGSDALILLANLGAPLYEMAEWAAQPGWKDAELLRVSGSSSLLNRVDKPAHPNVQKLFINWWLSNEGQTAFHTLPTQPPPPTLREDVTEWGITTPADRRDPNKKYLLLDLADDAEQIAEEAVALIEELLAQRRAR